jgi:hypothetical protein
MKSDGVKLLKQDKIDFMEEWREDNQDLLAKAGLANGQSDGTNFVSGLFFSLGPAKEAVPHLYSVSVINILRFCQ